MIQGSTDRPEFIWRNGAIIPWGDAMVHVNSVGHASVSAVFEGIRGYLSHDKKTMNFVLMEDHYERLLNSARLSSLKIEHTVEELCNATSQLVEKNGYAGDIYIRPWAFIAGVVREQIAPQIEATEVVIDTWYLPSRLTNLRIVRACVSSWIRPDDRSIPQSIKCFSNYHSSRLASVEAKHNGFDCPILLNNDFKVTESVGAGLAIVERGRIIFPPVGSGVFNSLTRAVVQHICKKVLNIDVIERVIDRTELYTADEILLFGTGWEICSVGQVDNFIVGRKSDIAVAIAQEFHSIVIDDNENNFVTKAKLSCTTRKPDMNEIKE